MQEKIDDGMNETKTLCKTQQTSQQIATGFGKSIRKLTTSIEELQTTVATIESEVNILEDRFAPITSTHELKELQQRFDSQNDFAGALATNTKALSARVNSVEKDVAGFRTVTEAFGIDALKAENESIKERVDHLDEEMKSTQHDLTVVKGSIEGVKMVQSLKHLETTKAIVDKHQVLNDKLNHEITLLRAEYVDHQSPGGEPEVITNVDEEMVIEGGAYFASLEQQSRPCFGDEGVIDPFGNDWTTGDFNEGDGYFASYEEEDRRCSKCGEEHEKDECGGSKGGSNQPVRKANAYVVKELVDVST
jgi:predicted nuclease with TOPRIM domain